MRSIQNPRLRQSAEVSVSVITNNNDNLRNQTMKENEIKNSIVPENSAPRKQTNNNNKRLKSHREAGTASTNSITLSDAKKVTATGFNVFYPAVQIANRHKYGVSHYEIQLSPVELLNASINTNRYREIETSPAIRSVLKLGGAEFHRRVMMAATQANAHFLVTTGTLEPLVNAFYGHMYNSRILYSLLCTAWRCQNQVNVIDEDQLYFSPMLNDHEIKNLTQGYNPATFARETDGATFTTNTVRQGYCFSDPTSNGVWANSVITPILQHVRLTRGWMKWIEEKFMRSYVVDPTDFNASPRMVVFWPTGAGVTASGGEALEPFSLYQAYGDEDQRYTMNASIQNLVTYVNLLTGHQAQFVADYPQLQLMWEYLGMSSSTTNFARDLDAKSLPVVHSYSVSKLIESASAGYSKFMERTQSTIQYYFNYVPTSIYISRDPAAQEQSFKTFEMASSSRTVANITYLDRVELNEGDFAICTGLIAPLSYQTMICNSTNHPYLWSFPLTHILTRDNVNSITPQAGSFGGNIYSFVRAITELLCINANQAPVLSRMRLQLYGTTAGATDGTTGIPDVRQGGTFTIFVPYYDLKDYYVSTLEAEGWRDSFLDQVLNS